MKIRPVGAELFHADGQTDGTMLIVAFRNISNAAKNLFLLLGLEAWTSRPWSSHYIDNATPALQSVTDSFTKHTTLRLQVTNFNP